MPHAGMDANTLPTYTPKPTTLDTNRMYDTAGAMQRPRHPWPHLQSHKALLAPVHMRSAVHCAYPLSQTLYTTAPCVMQTHTSEASCPKAHKHNRHNNGHSVATLSTSRLHKQPSSKQLRVQLYPHNKQTRLQWMCATQACTCQTRKTTQT
jgi:hypothetical protein